MIKIIDFKRRLRWIIWVSPTHLHEPIGKFLQLETEETQQETIKDILSLREGFKAIAGEGHMMEEAMCKDQREPLGAKCGPQLTASK